MTKYVKEGTVDDLKKLLPQVSNPNLLSEAELNALDVYIVTEDTTTVEDWQKVTGSSVTGTIETKTIDSTPLVDYIEEKIANSRKECEAYVYADYPSYKQLSALHGNIYSAAENQAILDGCADIINKFIAWKEHLRTLTTYEEVRDTPWITHTYDSDGVTILSSVQWEAS